MCLAFLTSNSPKSALLYGMLAGFISSLSLFLYLAQLSNVPVAILLSVLRAGQYGLITWLVSLGFKYLHPGFLVFLYPALSAGLDFIITLLSPHGSGGSLAYSQMDFLPLVQTASFGGVVMITFVLSMFATLLALVLIYRKVGLLVVWAISIVPFFIRPAESSHAETPLRVGLMTTDQFEGGERSWQVIWEEYKKSILASENENLDIVLLPEKLFPISEEDMLSLKQEVQNLAREFDLAIVMGVDESSAQADYNRAYFISAEGIQTYDKIHMIPGYESHFEIGKDPLVIDYRGKRIGIAICKDLDFPQTIRTYGESEVDLMLVPAWDFYEDDWFHSRMAVLRGVENGFTVVRSARRGFLTVSDSQGRILEEERSQKSGMVVLLTEVNSDHTQTVYSRYGDFFAWICLAYSLLMVAWVSKIYFRKKTANKIANKAVNKAVNK